MSKDSLQFYRGREARGQGKPRAIPDGRMSSRTRQEWYAGWDQEDQFRRPAPTPEESAEIDEALQIARDYLKEQGYTPTGR